MAGKNKSQIEAHKHQDTRVNIPTEELRDFVAEEEKAPKAMVYPRDPSLNPPRVSKQNGEKPAQTLAAHAVLGTA